MESIYVDNGMKYSTLHKINFATVFIFQCSSLQLDRKGQTVPHIVHKQSKRLCHLQHNLLPSMGYYQFHMVGWILSLTECIHLRPKIHSNCF